MGHDGMDNWIIFSGFIGIVLVGIIGFLGATKMTSFSELCWKPARFQSWSFANLTGILASFISMLMIAIFASGHGHMNSTGNATGMAMFLTLLFAFYKFGYHNILQMSRESAWRIHYTLGICTLVIGFAHTVVVFQQLGVSVVFASMTSVFGLVSLGLMFMGVIPAKFVIYDHFKVLHFLSFIGFLFTIYHMIDAAIRHKSLLSIFTAVVNCLVLLGYIGQRIYVWASSWKAVVQKWEVISEKEEKYIFLYLSIPGFRFKPGQWTRLSVPSLSTVSHPFTLIPTDKHDANVAIFIKVTGKFTKKLAATDGNGTNLSLSLQGPYGLPSLPSCELVLFVVGGIGVTPALSLLPSVAACGQKTSLFWCLRSEVLLQHALPFLQANLDDLSCITVKGHADQTVGRVSVTEWLEKMEKHHSSEGLRRGTIFVCGPASMAQEVRMAMKVSKGSMKWCLHVEEFQFLPMMQPKMGRTSRTRKAEIASKHEV